MDDRHDDAAIRAALMPLARMLAPLVAAEMNAVPALLYSTDGILPPVHPLVPDGARRSRRWVREHAAEIGAVRSGGKAGRSVVYTVTHANYLAWWEREHAPPASPSNVISLDEALKRAGMRPTKRASTP